MCHGVSDFVRENKLNPGSPVEKGLHFCFNEAEEMRAQLAEFDCVVEVGILSEPGWISVWSLPSSVANCRRSGRLDLDA